MAKFSNRRAVQLLRECGHSPLWISRNARVPLQSVRRWILGSHLPEIDSRLKLQQVLRIPLEAWTEEDDLAVEPVEIPDPEPAEDRQPAQIVDPQALMRMSPLEQLAHVAANIREERGDPEWAKRNLEAIRMAAKFQQEERIREQNERLENLVVKDLMIREHPDWETFLEALREALKPYPEAALAVADALEACGV